MTSRVLIVGRGTAGRALAADILRRGVDVVVGFLDDVLVGDDVVGPLSSVNDAVDSLGVDLIYIAIPSAPPEAVRRFIGTIDRQNLHLAIIPRTYAILTKETVDIDDLTDVDVLDLVGREPVKHDLISSTRFIEGKTILVTGAAGSIGSRLVRQLAAMRPAKVICVDWWENGMFSLGQEFEGSEIVHLLIGDIKNTPLLERIFDQYTPEVVFHAAAYKHVPLMQENPLEAVNNNVWGTLNLMRLAISHRVSNFVLVSTDKAVNPVNVMGATKRLGEMLMKALANESPFTRFNAVRFGNVIQSNGSVMQTFRSQIASRSPLTVTHEEVTRFFMTVDEASQLIIQSAFVGETSDIFVLDMGEPVRIMDLARSLIQAVDPTLEIRVIGLRPGEKMFEELSYAPEEVGPTANPKIYVVRDAVPLEPAPLLDSVDRLLGETLTYALDPGEVIGRLRALGFAVQAAPTP